MAMATATALTLAGLAATTGTAVGGAALQARGVNRATDAQARAAREAMRYQRERDASLERREYAAYQEYRQRYDEWINRFYGGNQSRGQSSGGGSVSSGPTASPGFVAPNGPQAQQPAGQALVPAGAPLASTGSVPTVPGAVLGASSAAGVPPLVPGTPQQPRTLADLSGWEDWRRYGVS